MGQFSDLTDWLFRSTSTSSKIHMDKMNVLITLMRGYGMGDAVQMSAVLRHVAHYRPHWRIDLQAEAGRFCIGNGIVDRCFEIGHGPECRYDAEVPILLYDTWSNHHDRPNTRVSSCLRERFGLEWDERFGRYQVDVPVGLLCQVYELLPHSYEYVGVHYEGDSSPSRKNLSHYNAIRVCGYIKKLGYRPLLLDWRRQSPMSDSNMVLSTGNLQQAKTWGGSVEHNYAFIRQCRAFVGIDSGPAKCASATDTPSLVVWTGHHPAPFHDPAPNTTHLVPRGYHGLEPVCDDPGVIVWFESHYNVLMYDEDPVKEIERWLQATLSRG